MFQTPVCAKSINACIQMDWIQSSCAKICPCLKYKRTFSELRWCYKSFQSILVCFTDFKFMPNCFLAQYSVFFREQLSNTTVDRTNLWQAKWQPFLGLSIIYFLSNSPIIYLIPIRFRKEANLLCWHELETKTQICLNGAR